MYQAASVTHNNFPEFDGASSVDLEEAKKIAKDRVEKIQRHLKASRVVVALSCPKRRYWRHDLLPTYKEHRGSSAPPPHRHEVHEFLEGEYESYVVDRLEADDVVGILATSNRTVTGPRVVVSVDKDLQQIPGTLYNPSTGVIKDIDETFADFWHLFQTLVGDSTDNYKGCPGIGPAKAMKALMPEAKWSSVVDQFVSKGLKEPQALLQARVARILRASDWDRVNKVPILWTPKENG